MKEIERGRRDEGVREEKEIGETERERETGRETEKRSQKKDVWGTERDSDTKKKERERAEKEQERWTEEGWEKVGIIWFELCGVDVLMFAPWTPKKS